MKSINLTRGKQAIVDEVDFVFLSELKWCAWKSNKGTGVFYAIANGGRTRMHNLVAARMGVTGLVDHKNGDGLDNQRHNLRRCSMSQNIAAASFPLGISTFRGVSPSRNGRWRAYVKKNQRQIWIGAFDTPEQAALARDARALQLWGEFAKLNFPGDTTPIPFS